MKETFDYIKNERKIKDESNVYNLTVPQMNIWNTEMFYSGTNINNICGDVEFKEKINFEVIEKAINYTIKNNDTLNYRIEIDNGNPVCRCDIFSDLKLEIYNLKTEKELKDLKEKISNTIFDLKEDRLVNFIGYTLKDKQYGIIGVFHHLCTDAWGVSLFIDRAIKVYEELLDGTFEEKEYPKYSEYVKENEEYLNSEKYNSDKEFWKGLFKEEPELTYISNNKSLFNPKSEREEFVLSDELVNRLNEYCKENRTSIYSLFMAIYSLYLANINNTESAIIGTPVLNRSNFTEKQTLGMFVSTVPFKVDINFELSFNEFIKEIGKRQIEIFRHQKYPYNAILEDVKKDFNLNENLFDFVVSYQNARLIKKETKIEYKTSWVRTNNISQPIEVHFFDMDSTGKINLYYDYQVDRFTKEEVKLIHERIEKMLITAIDNPKLKDIEIITDKDKEIINKLNDTKVEYDKNKTLIEVFDEVVAKNQDKTAIVFKDNKLTYKELDERSNQMANFLLSKKVKRNDVIGIMLNRSENILISILGVLKTGASFMLIDPSLPSDRVKYMITNANCPFIISDLVIEYEKYSFEMSKSYKADRINVETDNEDRFCVIYTSGSTGTPKGVELKRKGIINFVYSHKEKLKAEKCTNFLCSSTVAFDMFIAENFIPLLLGKTIVLATEDEQKIPVFTEELIKKNKVDFILTTPSKIGLILKEDVLRNVKAILLGGEALKEKLIKSIKEVSDATIFNCYGPSECTCCSTYKEVEHAENNNIGKPIDNVEVHIRNKIKNEMPVGIPGEMVITGDNVGLGYINKKKFNGVYETGDNAYISKDGELIYCGRQDNQIKLHGLRIELDEITKRLSEIKEIRNATTVIKKINRIDCICAYVEVEENTKIEETDIKKKLSENLPMYMIPSHIMILDKLPITLNGKIDDKHLPEIVIEKLEFVAPATSTEKYLHTLFKKVLGVEELSCNDSFFDIGGDSLGVIQVISEIYIKYNYKIEMIDFFTNATIIDLAKLIDTKGNKKVSKEVKSNIAPHKEAIYYPVSYAQRRIYYAASMEKDSLAYNTPFGIVFEKEPSETKIERILNEIINNHEALRTYFVLHNKDVVQKVAENIRFKLKVLNYNNEEFVQKFDLSQAPLMHAELNKYSGKFVLKLDLHHIICDGASMQVFAKEFCDLYNGKEIEKNKLDYIDFALNEKINNNDKKYWLAKFNDTIPLLNMPTDYERGNIKSEEGDSIIDSLTQKDEIHEFCKKLQITPYMLMLSAYYILLYKYTMQNDIVVGTPVVGREQVEFNNTIGMFVNTLAMRQSIQSSLTFKEFIKIVKENCLEAFSHQTYPFDELVRNLNIPRYSSRNPLFDVMFVYESKGLPKLDLKDNNVEFEITNNKTSKFDFSLEVTPMDDKYNLRLEYCTKLYKKTFIKNMVQHYKNIIENILNNENIQISKIQMLSEIPEIWPKMDYPKEKRIIDLFEEQVKIRPNEIALVADNGTYTYKQLEEKVNRLANYIRTFGKNRVIGLMLNRSAELIISMLAILKSGAGYLPLDPAYPKDRIKYIINDSELQVVLTQKEFKNRFNDIKTILVDEEDAYKEYKQFNTEKDVNDIAYMIYTSGSTGNPKGVMVSEQNTVNFIFGVRKIMPMDRKTIVSITTMCFDIFAIETIVPLTTGMKVVLANNEEQNNPILLNKLCLKNKVEMIQTTPSKFKFLISDKDSLEYIRKMKIIELAGEPFPKILLEEIKKITKSEVFNLYGPSETTIGSTVKRLTNSSKITIGKPVANTQILVLDNDMMPVPVNVPGRLFIGGDGVSLGYINKPEKTASVFINYNGNRVYDTGDLAKILPNGELEGLGRTDFQVKIRGLRIELGEIENQINKYKNVINSVVAVKNINGRDILCGYFKAEGRISVSNLKAEISKKLPNYMVPVYLIQLKDFEYTPNGKIDRKQLPIPKIEKKEIVKPKNSMEKKIYKIWKTILGLEQISIDDNFFDIGGDSLCALKMQLELMKININVNYGDLFIYNTIETLADFIMNGDENHSVEKYRAKDFKNINRVLRNNTIHNLKIQRRELKDVLLTGSTGYLGMHVLSELLKNDDIKIYCLIRSDLSTSAENKLRNKFQYYFGSDLSNLFGKRIFVIKGDLVEDKFGLSEEQYELLGSKVKHVINCAALVKHYGDYKMFEKINVNGVKNLIKFAEKYNKDFIQISTTSVSGSKINSAMQYYHKLVPVKYTERKLFVSQSLDNVYVKSKFEAEKFMLEQLANKKLRGIIIRVGNITNRYNDGKFQENSEENAYFNRMKAFLAMKKIPEKLLLGHVEITPVDYLSKAVVEIAKTYTSTTSVLHLYNENYLRMSKLVKYLENLGIRIEKVSDDEFSKELKEWLLDDSKSDNVKVLLNDLDRNNRLNYCSSILTNNDYTKEYLNRIGFKWPELNEEYIKKILKNI